MEFVVLALWALSIILSLWGTLYTLWRYKFSKIPPIDYPPISILKPLKGVDQGLAANIASFLDMDYPNYEILFSIASLDDPAFEIIKPYILDYPQRIKVILTNGDPGYNPKVNNLIDSEKFAAHDILLVSDSNVRAYPSYLKEILPTLTEHVGVASSAVVGFGGQGTGGKLEEMHLTTYVTRWMNFSASFGYAFVLGKSMLYKKSVAKEFGGIASLKNYLAEDYMMGLYMTWIGKDVALTPRPVSQYVGQRSVIDFWKRNYRWTVLQKHSAPSIFVMQPLSFALLSSSLLWFISPWLIPLSVLFFVLLDYAQSEVLGNKFNIKIWFLKELLLPFIWLQASLRNTVEWRGTKLKVLSKGLVRRA
jgi:ceramide glucosyltransferase